MENQIDIYEKTLGQMRIDVAVILNKVNYIETEMKTIKNSLNDMDRRYVLRAEHASMEELEERFVSHNEHLRKEELEEKFVTQVEFEPVKKSVYSFIAIITLTVIGAILSLVVIK